VHNTTTERRNQPARQPPPPRAAPLRCNQPAQRANAMRLAEDYVLAKTRASELSEVRNLNLWGNGITDVSVRAVDRHA
jgi:hypothetical protein